MDDMIIKKTLLTYVVLIFGVSNIFAQGDGYWWNQSVFYEIFVRSFYDSNGDGNGDFKGLIEKLDYLNDGNPETDSDLGITGIWLMPINPSPSYHGYDVTDYRDIESDYGTMNDFHEFLDSCDARGIKVIVDFVMNHSSTRHPWFINSATGPNAEFRDWYIWSDNNPGYSGSWGQQVWHQRNGDYYFGMFWSGMPDMNMANEDTKNEFFDISKFWLDTVGVAGFRLDAIKHLFEDGEEMEHVDATFDFLEEFNDYYKGVNNEAMTVGEVWSSINWVAKYSSEGRLDMCFEFDLAGDIISGVNSYNWTGINTQIQRMNTYYRALQFAPFLTNHDMDRVYNQIGQHKGKMKLAASILLTVPGVPFMYYGEELGMTGTGADENKRTPMQWTNDSNAGFTNGTPWRGVNSNYLTRNVAAAQTDSTSIWTQYRNLIKIRNNSNALKLGKYNSIETDYANLWVFCRYTTDEYVFVIHNFSPNDHVNPDLSIYSTNYYDANIELVDLQTGKVVGTATSDEIGGFEVSTNLTIPARGTALLKLSTSTSPVVDTELKVEDFYLFTNYPNPFNPSTKLGYSLLKKAKVTLSVYDMLGRKVTTLVDEVQEAGMHAATFNAAGLASGMYIQRLDVASESGEKLYSKTGKMMLLK